MIHVSKFLYSQNQRTNYSDLKFHQIKFQTKLKKEEEKNQIFFT